MKFLVYKTSEWKSKYQELEVNTLKELMNWIDSQEHDIIFTHVERYRKAYPALEIYDDYRE